MCVCKLVEAVTCVAARHLVILARLRLNRLENFLALLLLCAGKRRYNPEFSAVQAKLQELHASAKLQELHKNIPKTEKREKAQCQQ